jgi:dTDP-4-dehydrorhamnose reductase
MKILLTGKSGQVGFELQRSLAELGEVRSLDRRALDLTNEAAIRDEIRRTRPDVVVNAAAYTAVDEAESEWQLAQSVNAEAPRIMAEEAARVDALLVHYSTDYVFDGLKRRPYLETDVPNPLNVYGATKCRGEKAIQGTAAAHLILRSSWVYATRGRNFLLTILRLAHEREELRVVNDQIGAPTWSRRIAQATFQILAQIADGSASIRDVVGIYNISASGQTSWYGFAEEILSLWAEQRLPGFAPETPLRVQRIVPIRTEESAVSARRPLYSVLSNEKVKRTFGISLPSWQEQLRGAWRAAGAENFVAAISS